MHSKTVITGETVKNAAVISDFPVIASYKLKKP